MKRLIFALAAFAVLAGPVLAQPAPTAPGVRQLGAAAVNDCAKFVAPNTISSSGGACGGGGGSVSVTGADALTVIAPSPGTGTFTVGVNHTAGATNDCVKWESATKLGTTGAPCASAPPAGQSVLTFSGTPVASPYGTVCYPATGFTLANNTVYSFRANVQRPATTDAGVALTLDGSNGINLVWQNDNNLKLGYTVSGSTTQISVSPQVPGITNGTYTFALYVATDNSNGLTVWGEVKGIASLPPSVRATNAVTTGTWTPCVIAGGSSAQLRSTGIQYTSPF